MSSRVQLAHHRNHDDLARLATRAQTIAEGLDLRIPSHRGAGRIEQDRLHAGTAAGKATPQLRAPVGACLRESSSLMRVPMAGVRAGAPGEVVVTSSSLGWNKLTSSWRNRVESLRLQCRRGRRRCKMLEEGAGGVRLRRGGTDSCRVDDILLKLVRQRPYQLRAGFDNDVGGGDNSELHFASHNWPDDVGPAWYRSQFRLHLRGDAKALEHAL